MALTNEDLQAIKTLMKETLEPIEKRLDVLEIKQDVLSRKMDDVTYQVASLEHTSKKEFHKLNDEVDTLIAVLEAKDILPKRA